MDVRIRKYSEVRLRELRFATGWLALWRPTSIEGDLICRATKSDYSHISIIGWAGKDSLMLAEAIQRRDRIGPRGVRVVPFSISVAEWPGCFDLYKPMHPDYRGDRAFDFALHAAGTRYGYSHLARNWLRQHVSNAIPPIRNSSNPRWLRDCSALAHVATCEGGSPRLADFDCDVSPGDFARSEWWRYVGTLMPGD
jgi:hypothetical protein